MLADKKFYSVNPLPSLINAQRSLCEYSLNNMTMYKYSFKTKEVSHIFEGVTRVVNNSSVKIPCNKDKATVVELFDPPALFVGIPVEEMPDVVIMRINSDTTGVISISDKKVAYSIHENILYLRKTDYGAASY